MTELHLTIVFADGRIVEVCPTRDEIIINENMEFTSSELKYIVKETDEFIDYVVGE